jgi:hypothetical protein
LENVPFFPRSDYSEDEGSKFLLNVGRLLPDFTTSYPSRQIFSSWRDSCVLKHMIAKLLLDEPVKFIVAFLRINKYGVS